MNFYVNEIVPAQIVRLGERRGIGMGAVESSVWPTTGDLDTETASFALTVQQLAADIFNSDAGGGGYSADAQDAYQMFLRSWNTFVSDFNQWRDAAWFWNPTRRDQLLGHRARFNSLLAQFQALGGRSGAQIQAASPEPDTLDKAADLVTKVGIALGLGIAVYVGFSIWKEGRR